MVEPTPQKVFVKDKTYQGQNGTDTYTGYLLNEKMHGKGKYKWASGEIYDGEWKDHSRNGRGK